MMLSMISFTVASLAETVYIGRFGTNELAAISFTFPVVYTLQGISMGLAIGASSVVARSIGLGDLDKVRRLVTHGLLLSTGLSISLAYSSSFFIVDVYTLLGAKGEVLKLVVGYMQVWLIGMPVFAMTFVGTTLMRASGDARTPGYLSALGSILHIAMAPLFIFGLGPLPEMGLRGAAVSFVIARHLSFLLFIYCFVFRDRMIQLDFHGFFTSCREILQVGLPAMASNMIAPISMSVATRLLAGHGVLVVAGFGVATRIESMLVMLVWAIGMSIAPIAGQNWGARKFDRVRTALRLGNGFVLAWGLFSYLTLLLFGDFFVSLINDDPGVARMAHHYLMIAPLSVGFMGVMNIATNSFNAIGKPLPPLILSFLQMIVINIPVILLGNYLWGYKGIYAGGVLTTVLLGGVAWRWISATIKEGEQRAMHTREA